MLQGFMGIDGARVIFISFVWLTDTQAVIRKWDQDYMGIVFESIVCVVMLWV